MKIKEIRQDYLSIFIYIKNYPQSIQLLYLFQQSTQKSINQSIFQPNIQIFKFKFNIKFISISNIQIFNSSLKFVQILNMNINNFQEKAIRLVSVTEDGKYEVHQDGANFLSQIQKPIGVVSVAGLYRTGKSYLLNRMLLNKSSGFGVGSTINACTKGLWCWGTPIKGTTPDGEKINVIIIDSEGIGALDEDQNHDTKIFTLAVLSSSTFIYNSVGSIDENALQNLSLVVNLSKNIQINAHSEQEQVDPEELAQYFPTFCWVVRDFSLQLINGNGDPITSNEYLQRALALQKGFSDDIEDKNRIRRLLSAFFKARQCITLVRPLVSEAKLQQLEKLDLEELRPQFVEQVLQLRKKILLRLNPKKFKGQILDGKMYLNTLHSYVSAINEGAVPNMQNAWSYMCQQKCLLTYDSCIEDFQKQINQLQETIPHEPQNLTHHCDSLEEQILKKYLQETKGMQKQGKEQFAELKQRIKTVIKQIKKKNEKQSLGILKSFAFKNFQSIQKMMATGEFSKYQDYVKQLNNFYNSLLQNAPNLPNKEIVFLDFIKKAAIQGAQLFLKSLYKSIQNKRSQWQEQKNHLIKKSEDIKAELTKQLNLKKQQLKSIDQENTDLHSSLESCKQEISLIKQKQKQKQHEHTKQIFEKKQQYEKDTQELLKQISEIKELLKEAENEKYEIQKQLEKTKALYELKDQQYEKQLSEYKRKEESSINQMMKMRMDTQTKFDKLISDCENRVSEYKKKCQGQVHTIQQLKQKVEAYEQVVQTLQKQKSAIVLLNQKQTSKLRQEYSSKLSKYEQQIQTLQEQISEHEQKSSLLESTFSTKSSEILKTNSELQEKYITQLSEHKKQKALYEQKISFLEQELTELEESHTSEKSFYEQRISELMLENKEFSHKFNEEKIREMSVKYEDKIKRLEKQFEQEKYRFNQQMDLLQKEKNNVEFQLNIEKKSKETEIAKYEKIISTIQKQMNLLRNSFEEHKKQSKLEYENKVSELEYQIKELQMELETAKQQAEHFQFEGHNRSQQTIMQLKNYHELEKQKLEQKLQKEKEKYEKKLQEKDRQHEEKMNEEKQAYEQEIAILKEERYEYENQTKDMIDSLQHELDMKIKTYDGLEQQYKEQKVFYEKKQIQLVQKNQHLTQSLNEQRQSLQKRIQQSQRQRSKLQKQIITLNHQKDEALNSTKNKDQKVLALEHQISELQKQIQKIKSQSRSKESQVQNDFMDKIINYEKKIALNKQENEFLLKKNQQMEKTIDSKTKIYEEKIETMKNDLQMTNKTLQERRVKEVSELEQKYEKLKKSSKQFQTLNTKRVSTLQRQLAIQQQKCLNLQNRLNQHKSTNQSLEQKLSSQLQALKSNFSQQKTLLQQKIQNLKQTIAQIENDKQSQGSEYDKQVILLQNKIKYLEQNRQKSKKEFTEKNKKLQEMLAKIQKQKKEEKNAYENGLSEMSKKMEKKYHEETKELTLNYEKRQKQFDERLKHLEGENRKLSQKISSSSQNNSETSLLQERKLNELQQSEKRLMKQIETLKSSSKSYSTDSFLLYEKQKQSLKTKLTQKEEKLRQTEKLKQQYFYELEKERARTNVQKQTFVTKIQQLKQVISKLQRDLQKSQRQTQKLKVQKRASVGKVQLGRYSVNKSHYGLNNLTQRSGLQQSMSFLNVSVTSSIRDNKQGRSFSKMGKQYMKGYNYSKQNSLKQNFSQKNSQKQKDKQNFNPILDEQSFFGNYE